MNNDLVEQLYDDVYDDWNPSGSGYVSNTEEAVEKTLVRFDVNLTKVKIPQFVKALMDFSCKDEFSYLTAEQIKKFIIKISREYNIA